jgi:hypothetical protein
VSGSRSPCCLLHDTCRPAPLARPARVTPTASCRHAPPCPAPVARARCSGRP